MFPAMKETIRTKGNVYMPILKELFAQYAETSDAPIRTHPPKTRMYINFFLFS